MKERGIKRMIDYLAAFAIIAVLPTLAFPSDEIEKVINEGIAAGKIKNHMGLRNRNNDEKYRPT